jgi:hypothetical protein
VSVGNLPLPGRGKVRGFETKGLVMSRRIWLLVAVLATALAVAATAAAAPRHFKFLGGARHPGKPAQKHLIAVRHGRHIHWFSATHGLAKKRLPTIKLSRDLGSRLGTRAFGPTTPPNVTGVGTCTFGAQTTPDGMNYVQSYDSLFADALSCTGNNGGIAETNSFFPNPTCTNGAPQSVSNSPLEYATFTDGEWMLLCTVPDDNGSGGSQANTEGAPYVVYQQGFGCQAAVGVGSDDNTPLIVKNNDSLEYSQTYAENGQFVTAITTSCIGRLPHSQTVANTPVYHLVSCTQYDPNTPGGFVRGLGETITYPDRQYQETCNDPAYRQFVACTAGTNCSTDASADHTSDLLVTETPATAGTLNENVDYGRQLSCAGRQYGGYTGLDPNWYGFSYTGSGSKQLRYDLFTLPYNGDNNVQFCFGASVRFRANSDDGSSQQGTLPDGTTGQIGLLPSCDQISSSGPCVLSVVPINSDNPGEGTRVNVFIPQSFTGDPWGRM